ncbi:glycosyltransferase family 2 protein [Hirschia litorea]|uniref:Glycosyltransferase family 2 protein n=1 Tax=Hirschia litorea TaxID=1199156 RepID=A0ABW2IJQ1_9PROT
MQTLPETSSDTLNNASSEINSDAQGPKIAVIIPCYNEEVTIARVIKDFREALPTAQIFVYDNNSKDKTSQVAADAGAIVKQEIRQGKGFAIRRAFSDIDADVYLMVDGDATYDAQSARKLIDKVTKEHFDFVNGARIHDSSKAYRPGHTFGNYMLTRAVSLVFGRQTEDMLSGYKALSRRFVKSFPATSKGFEIETELMVHALELKVPIAEIETPYKERPEDSFSKLSTFKDGYKITRMIFHLVRIEKPLSFFLLGACALFALSLILVTPIFIEFLRTGEVRRFPTAFLAGMLGVSGIFSVSTGFILDLVQRARHEAKMLHYLSIKPYQGEDS